MHLDMLAKDIVVTYFQIRFLAFVGFVLRRVTENGSRMNVIILADLGPTGYVGVRHNARATSHLDRPVNNDIRTNLNLGVDLRLDIDNGGGMNTHERCMFSVGIIV